MNQRPNILLISERRTRPRSHRLLRSSLILKHHTWICLASEGTTFDNAYTACPICVPARMSFMTGQYVHQIGTLGQRLAPRGNNPHNGQLPRSRGLRNRSLRPHPLHRSRTPARLWQTAHGRCRKMETLEYGCPLAHARQPARQQQPRHRMRTRRKTGKTTTTAQLRTSPNASSNPAHNTPTVPSFSTPAS